MIAPLYVLAKPAGAACNLQCKYCYYLEKHALYAEQKAPAMSDEMLEHFVRTYIEAQPLGADVCFTWHGGEPLMRPLDFYRRALELQQRYSSGRRIQNVLQTNGTLLTDKWCEFLAQNQFLVGVSIDGPQEFHDEYRRNRGGAPTWVKVVQGIRLLNKHHVDWNAMAVVNDYNADYPVEFYRFFRDQLGCRFLQFTPIVERNADGTLTDFSVTPEQWGHFLTTLFDEWVKQDVGEVFVQLFDATLANWMGEAPSLCSVAPECGNSGALEWNGDLYSCDHFVTPQHRLGNIREQSLRQLMSSEKQVNFGRQKREQLPMQCQKCDVRFACNGECPKNRFMTTADGQPGLNYLCAGYQEFFHHVKPYMDFMAIELRADRDPANVMQLTVNKK